MFAPERGSAVPAASLVEISRVLEETARIVRLHAEAHAHHPVRESASSAAPLEITAALVRAILRIRRLRADYLPAAQLSAEWTTVLELFAAGLEGRGLNQSQLARAAEVPHTTGLRIARNLLRLGIVVAGRDRAHARKLMLALSEDAAEKVRAYLSVAIATVPYLA